MTQPIENCYWVEPGRFLAGEYPRTPDEQASLAKLNALVDAGVRAFVNLTETDEGLLPYSSLLAQCNAEGVTHERFGIRDISVPRSAKHTASILNAIDRHLAAGRIVYLHCWGGVGRTGVIVGCWLARHGYPGEAALARLRELWRQCPKSASRSSPETPAQEEYVVNWREPRTDRPLTTRG